MSKSRTVSAPRLSPGRTTKPAGVTIEPIVPFTDGETAGRKLNAEKIEAGTRKALNDVTIRDTLGAMSRQSLEAYVQARMDTAPDYGRYPELNDIYPEKCEEIRGFAHGAGVRVIDAAVYQYVLYRQRIESWWQRYNPPISEHGGAGQAKGTYATSTKGDGCSGVLIVGPEGILGAQSAESTPPRKPRSYKWRDPGPYRGLKIDKSDQPTKFVFRKPRTGYIESWGVGNERGVGCFASVSCWCWLDEPIEDTWPICSFPTTRFAATLQQAMDLYKRYTLFNWIGASQIWADTSGDGAVVEKSFRRIAVRPMDSSGVLWCTEGHFQSEEMSTYIRHKRLEHLKRTGKHLGAEDMQYYTDSAVRFVHIGEMLHQPWGRGYEHMRRVLTDHTTFPRAVCRHGGPDTDQYDQSVTMFSYFADMTHNRSFTRHWDPWKKFCCQVPEEFVQYPARP